METHAKVLGILNIVTGVLGLCTALFLMVVFGGVAGIVGPMAIPMPRSSCRSSASRAPCSCSS